MCAEGRPPRMKIPVAWDDDDFFIATTIADALTALDRAAPPRERPWSPQGEELLANELNLVEGLNLPKSPPPREPIEAMIDAAMGRFMHDKARIVACWRAMHDAWYASQRAEGE